MQTLSYFAKQAKINDDAKTKQKQTQNRQQSVVKKKEREKTRKKKTHKSSLNTQCHQTRVFIAVCCFIFPTQEQKMRQQKVEQG